MPRSNRRASKSATKLHFDPNGDGGEVWTPFAKDGRLANDGKNWVSSGERLAGAIAIRFTLQPGEKRVVPLVIAWDTPVAEFGAGRNGIAATPIFTARPEKMPRNRRDALSIAKSGAKPSTLGNRP